MKPSSRLLVGLMLAVLGCTSTQAATTPTKGKVAKARVSKAVKQMGQPDKNPRTVVVPAQIAPQGVALAMSINLRDGPATVTVPPVPSAVANVANVALPPPQIAYTPYQPRGYGSPAENPYLPKPALSPVQAFAPIQAVPDQKPSDMAFSSVGGLFSSLGQAIPILPDSGQSILPTIKKVYPTGEKPLVVVSFKCPTEVLGVTPPTIKLLHNLVDMGMEGINKTDLLSFNLQQVCQ